MPSRRFPPPWSAEVTPDCFIVRDADGQQLAYVYYESEPSAWPEFLYWPKRIIRQVYYAGQDCAFALHDALLEAGHAELAEHFRQETWHPKGCWVVDMILRKT